MSKSSKEDDADSEQSLGNRLDNYYKEIGSYLRVTKAQQILRRYFAMNAFDGAMTSLGVVIGAYISHIADPSSVIGIILISGVAMMVSGFSGTYLTESAERNHSLNELEDAMLVNLDNTIYGKASRFVPIFAAIVDGGAPFIASIPSVIPFYLSTFGLIPIFSAFIASIMASLLSLFTLGVYLGRVSGDNIWASGFKMVIAGIIVAALALLLNGRG